MLLTSSAFPVSLLYGCEQVGIIDCCILFEPDAYLPFGVRDDVNLRRSLLSLVSLCCASRLGRSCAS